MTPTSWFTFFSLIFLFLPGMYADYLSRRYSENQTETRLQELARIILGSVVYSVISVLILSLVNLFPQFRFIDLVDFSVHPADYYARHPQAVLFSFIFEILLAFLLVWLFDAFKVALTNPNFTNTSQWDILFRNRPVNSHSAPKWVNWIARKFRAKLSKVFKAIPGHLDDVKAMPVALVEMSNGNKIVGYVDVFSTEEAMEQRELILSQVQEMFKSNLPTNFQKVFNGQSKWSRMYVPKSSIISIEVVYFHFL